MAGLKLLSLAVAAVLLVVKEANAATTGGTAKQVDCSEAMNAARIGGRFVELTVEKDPTKQLPITTTSTALPSSTSVSKPNEAYINKVCDAMKNSTPIPSETKPVGTFAYAAQDGNEADCKAAVDYWKKAYSKFDGLPPVFKDFSAAPYNDANNVSLISLFNPKENPTVDCAYFKCPADAGGSPGALNALLCVTAPQVLKAQEQPFSEDEWKRINTAINSGSAAVPTAIIVGAAALAALFL